MIHVDIILAVCDVEGNFVVVKVSSVAEIILVFLMVPLAPNTPGLSIYESSFLYAPRCVSPDPVEPSVNRPTHLS